LKFKKCISLAESISRIHFILHLIKGYGRKVF
jgi:hypothetical protein